MYLQEMQQFQEKQKVGRADDIVGIDQPHTASIGMYLPDETQRLISNLPHGRFDIHLWTRTGPTETKQ